jgi:uroporphyrinogen III methyltransferase / synthase
VVPVYETRSLGVAARERLLSALDAGRADAALFTSSSTVRETLNALGADARSLLSRLTVASIGPVTSRTLEAEGIRIDVIAERSTVDGLLDALERFYQSPSR